MAIGVAGQRLPFPTTLFPITVGNPPTPGVVATNKVQLPSGGKFIIPSGQYLVASDTAVVQVKDPVNGMWTPIATDMVGSPFVVNSDGNNYRVHNPVGTVAAIGVTLGGVGYVASTPPAVTISSGGATAVAVVGGAIGSIAFTTNTSTVTSGVGQNYTYPPIVSIQSPGSGGVQATAIAVLGTGGQISGFTVVNQGAGYRTTNPAVQIVPQPDDPTIGTVVGATAQATLTGGGAVTAVLVTNNGIGTLRGDPVVTIAAPTAGTQATAKAIGVYAATSVTIGAAAGGSGYGGPAVYALGVGAPFANTSFEFRNPAIQQDFYTPRPAQFVLPVSTGGSGGSVTSEGQVLIDQGLLTQSSVLLAIIPAGNAAGGQNGSFAFGTVTLGSANANVFITPLGGSA